jgi:hypothetical protein
MVIGGVASVHVRGAIDRRALGIARLNADPVLCIGWVIDFRKIIVDHVQRTAARAAFISKTCTILYLGNLEASPLCRDLKRAANAITCKAEWVGKTSCRFQLRVQICYIGYPFNAESKMAVVVQDDIATLLLGPASERCPEDEKAPCPPNGTSEMHCVE